MESNLLKNFDQKNLILTILVTMLVLAFHLNINRNMKCIFLLFSLLICIYDLRYLIPFIVSFLILTIHNLKKKNIKEHFNTEEEESFTNKLIRSIGEENENSRNIRENFMNNLYNIPFFSEMESEDNNYEELFFDVVVKRINQNEKNSLSSENIISSDLYNLIIERTDVNIDDLYQIMNLDNLDEFNQSRNEIIGTLDGMNNSFLKKLGILFKLSPRREYQNFIFKISQNLGLSEITNNNLSPERPIDSSDFVINNYNISNKKYLDISKKVDEAALIIFSKNINQFDLNSVINFDLNTETNLPNNNNLFEIEFNIDENLNDLIEYEDDFFDIIKEIIETDFNFFSNLFMLENYGNISTDEDKLSYFYRVNSNIPKKIISIDYLTFTNTLTLGNDRKEAVEDSLNEYNNALEDVFDSINLFSNILRPISEIQDKNKKKLQLHYTLFIFILLTNESFGSTFDSQIDRNTDYISASVRNFFNTKKDSIYEKINNINIPKFSSLGLNTSDIFFNSVFFYLKTEDIDEYFLENLLGEEEEIEPPTETNEEELQPRWYDDSELKTYFDVNKMNDEKEAELEKYYKAMNFNDPNLKEISKQAEIRRDEKKIEDLSFNKKIDDFSGSIFNVIDKMRDLFKSKLEERNSENNLEYYLDFCSKFSDIITNEDDIVYVGSIFILISLFLYFIDSTSSTNKNIGIIDLFKEVKISI